MYANSDRAYRVWLYRRYTDVRLDGRWHLIHLNLHPDADQALVKERLTKLFDQLTAVDGLNRWDRNDCQLLITDTPDGVAPTRDNSFWWAPNPEERR